MTSHNVVVKNFSYTPDALMIEKGHKVIWTVQSGKHTVTADDGAFDSGDVTKDSPPFEVTFNDAGEFGYFCAHHSEGMTGKVTVKDTA
ncbi:hypothetical protein BH10PSE6_BH10PSE6_05070 [soil metagenome]